jgi:hypothetical protein
MTGVGGGEMTLEFTEFDGPRRITEQVHLATIDVQGQLQFEPVSGGTRMRWAWDIEPHGPLRLVTPLVRCMGERQERTIRAALDLYGRWGEQPSDPPAATRGPVRVLVPSRRALHAINSLVTAILRSPFHGLLSSRVLLLTYMGRRTGKLHTTPVGCVENGNTLTIFSVVEDEGATG